MLISNLLQQRYDQDESFLRAFKPIVDKVLFAYCSKNNFAYSSRIKSIHSLNEKIETGRFQSWKAITDIFAATVIIPNLREEVRVIEELGGFLTIKNRHLRGTTLKNPDVFHFDSTRLDCCYPNEEFDQEFNSYVFEVQVRTAFEHAWQIATHDFSYKTDTIEWKKKRLTALLKASVEQLDLIIANSEAVKNLVDESVWYELNNLILLQDFIQRMLKEGVIPSSHTPKDLSRFVENLYRIIKSDQSKSKTIDDFIRLIELDIRELHNQDLFPSSISLFSVLIGIISKHMEFRTEETKRVILIDKANTVTFFDQKSLRNVLDFDFT